MRTANTIAEAAEILTTHAEELRIGSTYYGDWQNEHEAKTDFERITRVVRELRMIEDRLSFGVLSYLGVVMFLVGYGAGKWLG